MEQRKLSSMREHRMNAHGASFSRPVKFPLSYRNEVIVPTSPVLDLVITHNFGVTLTAATFSRITFHAAALPQTLNAKTVRESSEAV